MNIDGEWDGGEDYMIDEKPNVLDPNRAALTAIKKVFAAFQIHQMQVQDRIEAKEKEEYWIYKARPTKRCRYCKRTTRDGRCCTATYLFVSADFEMDLTVPSKPQIRWLPRQTAHKVPV